MLYYPVNPDKSFRERVIAEEGDTVKITDGRVFVTPDLRSTTATSARIPQATTTGDRKLSPTAITSHG